MATHSGILDWKIPWAEEPGRLHSVGRKELDRLKTHTHTHTHTHTQSLGRVLESALVPEHQMGNGKRSNWSCQASIVWLLKTWGMA